MAQHGGTAGKDAELLGQSRSRGTAQSQPNLAKGLTEPAGSPCITRNCTWQSLREDALPATRSAAEEPPHVQLNLNGNPFPGEIGQLAAVTAMHAPGLPLALRAETTCTRRAQCHDQMIPAYGPQGI